MKSRTSLVEGGGGGSTNSHEGRGTICWKGFFGIVQLNWFLKDDTDNDNNEHVLVRCTLMLPSGGLRLE